MTESWTEDRTRYNEGTLFKVQRALHNAGLSNNQKRDCITEMLNEGILFRERLDDPAERSDWEDADVADFLARDRAARAAAAHEFKQPTMITHPYDLKFCARLVPPYGQPHYCGQRADHPIHQATPEGPAPNRCRTTVGGHPSGIPMRCASSEGHETPHHWATPEETTP